MARDSDGLRESLARVARQTLGADAARVRLAAKLEDGLSSTGAAPIGLELLALRERRVVGLGGLGSDSRVWPRSAGGCPAPRCWPSPSRTTARAMPRGVVTLLWRRTREFERAPTSRWPSVCASRPPRPSNTCSWRRPSAARARQRASCSAWAGPAADLAARGAAADRGAGREPTGRRCLRPAPARGGRVRPPRGRGCAGRGLGGERLPVSDVLAAEVLATSRPVALRRSRRRWTPLARRSCAARRVRKLGRCADRERGRRRGAC